ncbi:bifunctional transcriptional activator/DNA repair enzyme AdaA [Streptomyces sp. NRRL S-87]|uniref:bifunctional transcriptional activator/DNA repair enzyme AdaA n=1 Tax=Streptomyces sp. NRRL S-87 TaxID=1463920 RepID=UPI00068E302E|nr:Ada metal-binding domain-containing protein [Streptomyces sp. NRRL S-87]
MTTTATPTAVTAPTTVTTAAPTTVAPTTAATATAATTAETTVAPAYASDDERWRAVLERDEAADGVFYYAVTTTGIYSRPSCAARSARRENVEFHTSLAELRARGYRPCRRCHPGEPDPQRHYADTVARACALMDGAAVPPNLDELAQAAGYSRFHFHRMFKSLTGVTPYTYWTAVRARRVREELLGGARTVSDAIYRAGFNTNGQFYAVSGAILGMAPQAFRAGGAGVAVRSAVGATAAGPVLVAVADRGVCAVLDDRPGDRARDRLAALFPQARHAPADAALSSLVQRALQRAEPPEPALAAFLPRRVVRTCRDEVVRHAVHDHLTSAPASASASMSTPAPAGTATTGDAAGLRAG